MAQGVGEFVRKRRKELKLSQHALAEQVGVTQAYMSQIETGKKLWPDKYINALARALGVHRSVLEEAAGREPTPMAELADLPFTFNWGDADAESVEGQILSTVAESAVMIWMAETFPEIRKGADDGEHDGLRQFVEMFRDHFHGTVEMKKAEDGTLSWTASMPPLPESVRSSLEARLNALKKGGGST